MVPKEKFYRHALEAMIRSIMLQEEAVSEKARYTSDRTTPAMQEDTDAEELMFKLPFDYGYFRKDDDNATAYTSFDEMLSDMMRGKSVLHYGAPSTMAGGVPNPYRTIGVISFPASLEEMYKNEGYETNQGDDGDVSISPERMAQARRDLSNVQVPTRKPGGIFSRMWNSIVKAVTGHSSAAWKDYDQAVADSERARKLGEHSQEFGEISGTRLNPHGGYYQQDVKRYRDGLIKQDRVAKLKNYRKNKDQMLLEERIAIYKEIREDLDERERKAEYIVFLEARCKDKELLKQEYFDASGRGLLSEKERLNGHESLKSYMTMEDRANDYVSGIKSFYKKPADRYAEYNEIRPVLQRMQNPGLLLDEMDAMKDVVPAREMFDTCINKDRSTDLRIRGMRILRGKKDMLPLKESLKEAYPGDTDRLKALHDEYKALKGEMPLEERVNNFVFVRETMDAKELSREYFEIRELAGDKEMFTPEQRAALYRDLKDAYDSRDRAREYQVVKNFLTPEERAAEYVVLRRFGFSPEDQLAEFKDKTVREALPVKERTEDFNKYFALQKLTPEEVLEEYKAAKKNGAEAARLDRVYVYLRENKAFAQEELRSEYEFIKKDLTNEERTDAYSEIKKSYSPEERLQEFDSMKKDGMGQYYILQEYYSLDKNSMSKERRIAEFAEMMDRTAKFEVGQRNYSALLSEYKKLAGSFEPEQEVKFYLTMTGDRNAVERLSQYEHLQLLYDVSKKMDQETLQAEFDKVMNRGFGSSERAQYSKQFGVRDTRHEAELEQQRIEEEKRQREIDEINRRREEELREEQRIRDEQIAREKQQAEERAREKEKERLREIENERRTKKHNTRIIMESKLGDGFRSWSEIDRSIEGVRAKGAELKNQEASKQNGECLESLAAKAEEAFDRMTKACDRSYKYETVEKVEEDLAVLAMVKSISASSGTMESYLEAPEKCLEAFTKVIKENAEFRNLTGRIAKYSTGRIDYSLAENVETIISENVFGRSTKDGKKNLDLMQRFTVAANERKAGKQADANENVIDDEAEKAELQARIATQDHMLRLQDQILPQKISKNHEATALQTELYKHAATSYANLVAKVFMAKADTNLNTSAMKQQITKDMANIAAYEMLTVNSDFRDGFRAMTASSKVNEDNAKKMLDNYTRMFEEQIKAAGFVDQIVANKGLVASYVCDTMNPLALQAYKASAAKNKNLTIAAQTKFFVDGCNNKEIGCKNTLKDKDKSPEEKNDAAQRIQIYAGMAAQAKKAGSYFADAEKQLQKQIAAPALGK